MFLLGCPRALNPEFVFDAWLVRLTSLRRRPSFFRGLANLRSFAPTHGDAGQNSSRPNGFSRKSTAPACMARTAMIVAVPVIMIDGKTIFSAEPRQKLEPIHFRKHCVDHQTSLASPTSGSEKRFATREALDRPSMCLEHLTEVVAYNRVVVDHEDCLTSGASRGVFPASPVALGICGDSPSSCATTQSSFGVSTGLSEMCAELAGDGAQSFCRNIASQHNCGNSAARILRPARR